MKIGKTLSHLLVLLLLGVLSAHGSVFRSREVTSSEISVDPMKFVPYEFVDAYKGFVSDIVSNEIFVEHSRTFGASAGYTFGLGQLLAVLNERMFNVPNAGFDEALRTELGSITTAYKDMTESLLEDSNVFASNSIYTSNRTLEPTNGIKALSANVFYQDFSQPHIAVPSINSRISIQTFSKIRDKLIPKGGWYGPSIYSFTKGVFVNTFFYKNKFLFPFVDIGKHFFGTDRVRMIGTHGTFKIRRTQEFTTVTLPFKDKRKSLVLVLPKGDLTDVIPFLDSALDSKKPDGFVETKPLVIQVPAMNFTVSNEFFSQFFWMGANQSMCNWNDGFPYFLQPPAQALYYYLDVDKFEAAAATGVQLNSNKEFQDITGIKPTPKYAPRLRSDDIKGSDDEDDAGTTISPNTSNPPSSTSSSTPDPESLQFDSGSEEDGISSEEIHAPIKGYRFLEEEIGPVETIRFDRPFYWYLQDEVLGPVYVGVVNSFKTYKTQVSAIEDGFDDMFKFQFWSCGPKHLALIDLFSEPISESGETNV